MFYKNNSYVTKTFYGVTFKPGDIKFVPGYIRASSFDLVDKPKPKEPPKQMENATKSDKPIELNVEVTSNNDELTKSTRKPRKSRKMFVDSSIINVTTDTEDSAVNTDIIKEDNV